MYRIGMWAAGSFMALLAAALEATDSHNAPVAGEQGAILGVWVTEGGKARVEVTESGEKYYGKIVWLKEPNYPAEDEEAG